MNYLNKKKQLEYIPGQINKIRNSVEDRRSQFPWQTVNEMSKRKSTLREKLKAASQHERLQQWKEHFKNLLGSPPEITDKPYEKLLMPNETSK